MTLHLFDTATREVREFVPLVPGQVGIYVCGATVQAPPHVGHLRKSVAFDVLVRWLRRSGLRVTLVQNVTDIDDKILAKSAEAGEPWWAWAQKHERMFAEAERAVGVLPPTVEPRATGHVPDMVELMETLVARGHAYAAGEGDVYFDVRSFPEYGALTNQGAGDLTSGEEESSDKRDPRDFALWKANRPGEPASASWATPFGRGRPGWHLECSAMARRYLGSEFDIHGGGLDLRFPHHENEQAQSRAAGDRFARYWLHSAWVTQGGAKMSKSLGNSLQVATVLATAQPVVLRYALATVHYRSMLEYTPDTLREAEAAWGRLAGFVRRAEELLTSAGTAVAPEDVAGAPLPPAFAAAMDDDLNVPAALAVVFEHLHAGNDAVSRGDVEAAREGLLAVRTMLDVLGLDPGQWRTAGDGRADAALAVLVAAELDLRAQARAAKDWPTADAVRQRLQAAGISVEDSPTGARWSLAQDQED